jgi:hypothetical protein
MYEEYLGEGYHERVRKMLTADEKLLPNSIIDAELNIGTMKALTNQALNRFKHKKPQIDTEEKLDLLKEISIYYLCAVLCVAMKSRTSVKPFNLKKYDKNWGKKRERYAQKGKKLLHILISQK